MVFVFSSNGVLDLQNLLQKVLPSSVNCVCTQPHEQKCIFITWAGKEWILMKYSHVSPMLWPSPTVNQQSSIWEWTWQTPAPQKWPHNGSTYIPLPATASFSNQKCFRILRSSTALYIWMDFKLNTSSQQIIFQLSGLSNCTSPVFLQCFFLSLESKSNFEANKTTYRIFHWKWLHYVLYFLAFRYLMRDKKYSVYFNSNLAYIFILDNSRNSTSMLRKKDGA